MGMGMGMGMGKRGKKGGTHSFILSLYKPLAQSCSNVNKCVLGGRGGGIRMGSDAPLHYLHA